MKPRKTAFAWTACGAMVGALLGGVAGTVCACLESRVTPDVLNVGTGIVLGTVAGILPALVLGGLSAWVLPKESRRGAFALCSLTAALLTGPVVAWLIALVQTLLFWSGRRGL